MDGGDQFRGGGFLHQVTRCAATNRFRGRIGILVHGQDNDARIRQHCFDPFAGVEAVELRHGNIDQENVRLQSYCLLDQSPSVRNRTHNLVYWLEQLLESIEQDGMIIRQKDACSIHSYI